MRTQKMHDRQGGQIKRRTDKKGTHRKVTGKVYKCKTPEDEKARIKIIKQMKNQRQRYLTEEEFLATKTHTRRMKGKEE
jgi:hypothetical protein